jgi:hypothetical protein
MNKPRHRVLVPLLVALGGLLTVLAVFAVWAERQVLNTDEWVNTSSELLQDDKIQSALQTYLVDQLFENVDVQAEVASQLPPGRAQLLAGPIKGALEQLANEVAQRALDSPRLQAAWEQANRTAHELLLNLVEGDGNLVEAQGGVVTLDLRGLVQEVASRLGIGQQVADKLPESAAQVEILRSDQLEAAQTAANLIRKLAIAFTLLGLGSFGLAIYLAQGRRPRAIFSCGVALVIAGIAIYALRAAAGQVILDALVKNDAIRPAAESTWSIATSLLTSVATTVIVYGALFIVAAWLGSSFAAARATRQFLAPALRDHVSWFYGLVVLAGLLYFALAPTHGVRALLTLIVLFTLAGVGVAALRRQAVEEFPDADGFRWPQFPPLAAGLRPPPSSAEPVAADSRLDQLERLARLREQGVLTDEELAAEKARVMAAAN